MICGGGGGGGGGGGWPSDFCGWEMALWWTTL